MSVSSSARKLPNINTACFSVTADTDPGTFPRVIELFAKRGLTPLKCHSSQTHMNANMEIDTQQVIDIQMTGMDQALANKIGASLRQTYGVFSVLLSTKTNAF